MKLTIQVYRDRKRQFRWRARSGNRQIVATSGEGYKRRRDCVSIAKRLFPSAFEFHIGK